MSLAFAQAVGVAPSACVMVGDSETDMRAGHAAGFRCLAVRSTFVAPNALLQWARNRFAGYRPYLDLAA